MYRNKASIAHVRRIMRLPYTGDTCSECGYDGTVRWYQRAGHWVWECSQCETIARIPVVAS